MNNETIKSAVKNNYTISSSIIPKLGEYKKGKVGDVYFKNNEVIVIRSDRLSSFDIVSGQLFPFKGQVLTELAYHAFNETKNIVPNAVISHPDPNILVQKKVKNTKIEWVVRGYSTGSLWRDYAKGQRKFKWFELQNGITEFQKFDDLLITPTTKAEVGHDESISLDEILSMKYLNKEQLEQIKEYSLKLFSKGSESAKKNGLILVDTKYEFGFDEKENILLIDEVHTLDSSRFWLLDDYISKQNEGFKNAPKSMSKEVAREDFRNAGYKEGNTKLPLLSQDQVVEVCLRYVNMLEQRTGIKIEYDPNISINPNERIINNLNKSGLL
jgi:phosphoribosylaminoimidazole-succinocarboxamide synthase